MDKLWRVPYEIMDYSRKPRWTYEEFLDHAAHYLERTHVWGPEAEFEYELCQRYYNPNREAEEALQRERIEETRRNSEEDFRIFDRAIEMNPAELAELFLDSNSRCVLRWMMLRLPELPAEAVKFALFSNSPWLITRALQHPNLRLEDLINFSGTCHAKYDDKEIREAFSRLGFTPSATERQ